MTPGPEAEPSRVVPCLLLNHEVAGMASIFLSSLPINPGKEIKPVNPKGDQPCMFIGQADTKAKAPILWPPDAKS